MTRRERSRDESRKRWSQVAIGLFICVLMVLSIIQFADYGNTSTGGLKFNGYEFTPVQGGGFGVTLNGEAIVLQDLPVGQNGTVVTFQNVNYDQVTVESQPGVVHALRNSSLHVIAFDPMTPSPAIQTVELARFYLMKHLPNTIGATLRNSSQYPTLPVVSCADAQGGVMIVRLLLTNTTTNAATFTLDGACLTVEGDSAALLAAKDFLLLSYVGVIPDEA